MTGVPEEDVRTKPKGILSLSADVGLTSAFRLVCNSLLSVLATAQNDGLRGSASEPFGVSDRHLFFWWCNMSYHTSARRKLHFQHCVFSDVLAGLTDGVGIVGKIGFNLCLECAGGKKSQWN